jgi:hypothetical protein
MAAIRANAMGNAETILFVVLFVVFTHLLASKYPSMSGSTSTFIGISIWSIIFALLLRNRLVSFLTVLWMCVAFFLLFMPHTPSLTDQCYYQILKPIEVLSGGSLYSEATYTYLPTMVMANLPFATLGIDIRLSYMVMYLIAAVILFFNAAPQYRLLAATLVAMNPILLQTAIRLENNAVTVLLLVLAFVFLDRRRSFPVYAVIFLALAYCSRQFVSITLPLLFIYLYRTKNLRTFWWVCVGCAVIIVPFALSDLSAFFDGTLYYHVREVPERLWRARLDVTTYSFLTALGSLGADHAWLWHNFPSKLLQLVVYVGLIVLYWKRSKAGGFGEYTYHMCAMAVLVTLFAHSLRVFPGYFLLVLAPAMFYVAQQGDDAVPRRVRQIVHGVMVCLLLAYLLCTAAGAISSQKHTMAAEPQVFSFVSERDWYSADVDGTPVKLYEFANFSPDQILNPIDGYGWLTSREINEFRVMLSDNVNWVADITGSRIVDESTGQQEIVTITLPARATGAGRPVHLGKLDPNYFILEFPHRESSVKLAGSKFTGFSKVVLRPE